MNVAPGGTDKTCCFYLPIICLIPTAASCVAVQPIVVEPQVFDLLLYLLQKRSRGQQGRSHRFNLGRPDRVGYYPDQSHQERAKRGWRQISLSSPKARNWRALAIFCSTPCLGSPAWRRGRVRTKKPSAQQYLRTLRTQSDASKPGLSAVDTSSISPDLICGREPSLNLVVAQEAMRVGRRRATVRILTLLCRIGPTGEPIACWRSQRVAPASAYTKSQ